jgi:hypothetical protein
MEVLMGKSWKIIISGGFSIALFDCRRLPAFYGIKMGNILIDTMNHGKVGAPYFFSWIHYIKVATSLGRHGYGNPLVSKRARSTTDRFYFPLFPSHPGYSNDDFNLVKMFLPSKLMIPKIFHISF